jgi:hypothetical protein
VDEIDDGELLTGRERGGEEDAVGRLAIQSSAEKGDVLHGDSGVEAWVIWLGLWLLAAAGWRQDKNCKDQQ